MECTRFRRCPFESIAAFGWKPCWTSGVNGDESVAGNGDDSIVEFRLPRSVSFMLAGAKGGVDDADSGNLQVEGG